MLEELKTLVMITDELRKEPQYLTGQKQDRQRQQIAPKIGEAACAEDRHHGQDNDQTKDIGGGVRTEQSGICEQDRYPRDDAENLILRDHKEHDCGRQEDAHECRNDVFVAEGGAEVGDSCLVITVEHMKRIDIEEVEPINRYCGCGSRLTQRDSARAVPLRDVPSSRWRGSQIRGNTAYKYRSPTEV